MKYLFWLIWILVPVSMIVSRVEAQMYLGKEYECEITLCESGQTEIQQENELERRMKELHLVVPIGIEMGCNANGWVKWKFVEYKDSETDQPIAYVLQYLSVEDMEKWEKKEFIFNLEVKAELVFCHKHKRASHFRFFIDGVEQIIHLHEKTGGA